jgi:hypothetical protein
MFVRLMKKHVSVPGMSRIPWKRSQHSLPKPRVQSGRRRGILHERRVFHLFSGDGMDDGVCLVLPRPMAVAKGDGHVDCVHSTEVVL